MDGWRAFHQELKSVTYCNHCNKPFTDGQVICYDSRRFVGPRHTHCLPDNLEQGVKASTITKDASFCRIFIDAGGGEHISRTAARAREAGCQFFVFNGFCVPSDLTLLPEGIEYTDCPPLSEWYLHGHLDCITDSARVRERLATARERRRKAAIAALTPQQREDLML